LYATHDEPQPGLIAVPPALALAGPLAAWSSLDAPSSLRDAARAAAGLSCASLTWSFATVVPCAILYGAVVHGSEVRFDLGVALAVSCAALAAITLHCTRWLGADSPWVGRALVQCWTVGAGVFVAVAIVAFFASVE
jgi:hypothetical protein